MRLMQMESFLIVLLCALCLFSDAISPFKNRGNGIGVGLMMNNPTGNPPNLFTPLLSSHGHGGIRPPNFVFGDKFGDKFPQYQTPVPSYAPPHHNYHNKYHNHFIGSHQTNSNRPRQFRNPFDVIYEWRQLDFDYPTFLDRQRAILNGDFIPTNTVSS